MAAPLDRFHLVGTLVGDQYRVEEVLAESSLSLDYRGTDERSEAAVRLTVLKVLGELTTRERRAILDRLFAAARATEPLGPLDPAIRGLLDAGAVTLRDGNWVPYVAQPHLTGVSLEQIRDEEMAFGLPPRTLAQAMQVLAPAARALGVAADKGVVHGGLTPGCIAVLGDPRSSRPRIEIFDWGLARAVHEALAHATSSLSLVPTALSPRFAAPEQLETHAPATLATDVYAFALVMAHLMAYPPSDPKLARDPAPFRTTPGRRGAALPAAAEALFERALAPLPADRPPDVAAFWQELEAVRASAVLALSPIPGSSPGARPPPSSDRMMRLPAARPDDKTVLLSTPKAPKSAKKGQRRQWLWLVLALLLFAATSAVVAWEFGLTRRVRGLFSASP
jgi:eukaryotic-like serine/threonine-protein kinase